MNTPLTPSTAARSRTYFTERERLDFVQLIVANQGEYPMRNKARFWTNMSAIFADTHDGKTIKYGARFVSDMVAKHVAKRRAERAESGTVQRDTELDQALDQWVEVEKRQQDMLQESAEAEAQRQREREATAQRRGQMTIPHYLRHSASADTLSTPGPSTPAPSAPSRSVPHPLRRAASAATFGGLEDEVGEDDVAVPVEATVPARRPVKRARRGEEYSAFLGEMTEAVSKLTANVQPADQGGNGALAEEVKALAEGVKALVEDNRERREEIRQLKEENRQMKEGIEDIQTMLASLINRRRS